LLTECKTSLPLEVNTIVYNSALQACATSGKWQQAVELLREMHMVCIPPAPNGDRIGGGGGSDGGGRAFHPKARPDASSFNSTMHACAKAGEVDTALAILQAMVDGSVAALAGTAAGANAPTAAGDPTSGAPRPARTLPPPNAYSYTSALYACSKAGKYAEAKALLTDMPREHRTMRAQFNIVMSLAARHRDWEGALALLAMMRAEGLEPDAYNFSPCLQACVNDGGPAAAQAGVALLTGEALPGEALPGGAVPVPAACDTGRAPAQQPWAQPWVHSVGCLAPAITLLKRAGQYERALELELELGKLAPRAHMALETRRSQGASGTVVLDF